MPRALVAQEPLGCTRRIGSAFGAATKLSALSPGAAIPIAHALDAATCRRVAHLTRRTFRRVFARCVGDTEIVDAVVIGRAVHIRKASNAAPGRGIARRFSEGGAHTVEIARAVDDRSALSQNAVLTLRAVAIEQARYAAPRQRIANQARSATIVVARALTRRTAAVDGAARID